MEMDKGSGLPAFNFPVVAWAPEAATGDPCDDGLRELHAPPDVTTIYFPEIERRLGWMFVDAEGRCWESVSSRVTGRADAWWTRSLPEWLHHPRYRLALIFEERAPMSFDQVKSRLFASVRANPECYGYDSRRARLEEIRAANSLRDLIKTEEQRAIDRLEPPPLWWQWLFWEGRCSRPAFFVAGVSSCAAVWVAVSPLRMAMPWFLLIVIATAVLAFSAVVRRLHDLSRTGWWIAVWGFFSLSCALAHDHARDPGLKSLAAAIWQAATLCALGFVALAPGTRGPNRYGFARRQSNERAGGDDGGSLPEGAQG